MASETYYEWGIEFCDDVGDIIDNDFAVKLTGHKRMRDEIEVHPDGSLYWVRLVLIRNRWGDSGVDREWCYITKDGEMPEVFDEGTKVPKRYLAEFDRNKEWASKLGDRVDTQPMSELVTRVRKETHSEKAVEEAVTKARQERLTN